jgi:pyruvate formate lyase activating enzyme
VLVTIRIHSSEQWIGGVCLTGGEPTLRVDLSVLVSEFKQKGFLVKFVTNGANSPMLEQRIHAKGADFVSMEVKAPLDSFRYQRAAGLPVDLNLDRKSIELLKREKVEDSFRRTVVPRLHREEDVKRPGGQWRAGSTFIL